MTAAARSGACRIRESDLPPSALKRFLDTHPDRQKAFVVSSWSQELDACWQAGGVRSGWQRKPAHPEQIAEKRIVDGADVGDAKQFVVALERIYGGGGHGGRRQHQERSLQFVGQRGNELLAPALQVERVTLGDTSP